MRTSPIALALLLALSVTAGCSGGPTSSPLDKLVVRDGDEVRATGSVQAKSGEPARLCAPGIELAVWPPKPCAHAIDVVRLRTDQLEGAQEEDGTTYGRAYVEGRFSGGVLTVTRQDAPGTATPAVVQRPGTPQMEAVRRFVDAHPRDVSLFSTDTAPRLDMVRLTPDLARTLAHADFDGVAIAVWLTPLP